MTAETEPGATPAPPPAQSDTATAATDDGGSDAGGASGAADSSQRDIVADPPAKTAHDALAAAQKIFDGKPSKVELERRHGETLEYKVKLVSPREEYDVQFDAETLEVLREEREPLDADDNDYDEVFSFEDVVPLADAAAVAREAQSGSIREWKLEGKDDGRVLYEFDIVPQGASDDVEVKVDAFSGSLVSRG
ncbi:PepSY domain-containing protein [Leucobacter sp. HY1910]